MKLCLYVKCDEDSYELLCCSQASAFVSVASCNGFLLPNFPREFHLGWDIGCIEGGTGSVSAKAALFEPQ